MSSFRKTPASHWRANTYSALSFNRINVFNMAHLHFDITFTGKCKCAIVSVSQLKLSFSDACQMPGLSNRLFCSCFPSLEQEAIIIIIIIIRRRRRNIAKYLTVKGLNPKESFQK